MWTALPVGLDNALPQSEPSANQSEAGSSWVNLEITYTLEHHDLSFLQSIQEVSGYVLIAMNEAATIPLVNLRLIRGQNLYEGQYALLVMSNYNRNLSSATLNYTSGLRQLQLSSLTVTKLQCAEQCSRRCLGPKPSDCCNEHCAAGCTGPRATDCLACKEFNDDGTCKNECPPLNLYDPKTYQVVSNPNAKYTFGATCVKACPHNYVVTGGSCVRTCSAGMHEVEENGVQVCKECDGPCPKACDGIGVGSLIKAMAVNASNIEDAHYKIPPMDLDKLEYFRTVKEITGYLLIQSWPENLTSLSVFENLEIIRGRTTRSLAVVRTKHLHWLGLHSLKEVSAGKVMLKDNRQLCYTQSDQWTRLFRSREQVVSLRNNAPAEYCEQQNQTCDEQCTAGGCWGPGPTMCVSCLHFERRGRCVASCNLLQGEPREVEVNSSCVECHPECLLKTGIPTCHGPVFRSWTVWIAATHSTLAAGVVGGLLVANGYPVRENSIAHRYITDPTHNSLDRDEFTSHEYMNQSMSETSHSSRQSEVLNPNYEDLSLSWGAASLPFPQGDLKPSRAPEGPEYLNTAQSSLPLATSDSLDNPDYQADFLPQATTSTTTSLASNGVFLPAAENLEYLGLGAALHAPVR
ncbi:hypothetical protein INR49_012212 [Caranx melampygus]|nr:hypothetical protein INR49_012212 [Caranx melampygus]